MDKEIRKLKLEIGQRILQARNDAGIKTNVELAIAIEKAMKKYGYTISETGLSALISGGSAPRTLTCLAFKRVLGVSLDYLIAGEKPPESRKAEKAVEDIRAFLAEIKADDSPELQEIATLLKNVSSDKKERALQSIKDLLELVGK